LRKDLAVTDPRPCPACGATPQPGDKFCSTCGERLPIEQHATGGDEKPAVVVSADDARLGSGAASDAAGFAASAAARVATAGSGGEAGASDGEAAASDGAAGANRQAPGPLGTPASATTAVPGAAAGAPAAAVPNPAAGAPAAVPAAATGGLAAGAAGWGAVSPDTTDSARTGGGWSAAAEGEPAARSGAAPAWGAGATGADAAPAWGTGATGADTAPRATPGWGATGNWAGSGSAAGPSGPGGAATDPVAVAASDGRRLDQHAPDDRQREPQHGQERGQDGRPEQENPGWFASTPAGSMLALGALLVGIGILLLLVGKIDRTGTIGIIGLLIAVGGVFLVPVALLRAVLGRLT
jgi:hypothetical protein